MASGSLVLLHLVIFTAVVVIAFTRREQESRHD